jgi:hypothetical protein
MASIGSGGTNFMPAVSSSRVRFATAACRDHQGYGRLLWDSHAAVFYYGAAFAVVGSVALLMLVAEEGGKHKQTKISGSN